MVEVKFYLYEGDLIGLPTNENHLVFRWVGPGKVLFSITRQGLAANVHFACDKKGLRCLKNACFDFVEFVFKEFNWCKMCIAHIGKESIGRLIQKIGFVYIGSSELGTIYVRLP
jgi:hypothetical protein